MMSHLWIIRISLILPWYVIVWYITEFNLIMFKTLLRLWRIWIFFSCLQAKTLSCHSVTYADRIHKTHGSEMKDYYSQHRKQHKHHAPVGFPCLWNPKEKYTHSEHASQLRNSKLREFESFIKKSKESYWRGTLFLLY